MRRKTGWIALAVILILLVSGSAAYVGNYYHADAAAAEALVSDSVVRVEKTGYGWYFDGPSEEKALIFYPGGKVEETAYAPLLHRLAEEGMDACLVRVPLRLAFTAIGKADEVMSEYDYDEWYVGGHSLGGVAAAYYAAKNSDALEGIVLLGAYSTKKLSDRLKTVLIYGSEDGILNRKAYEKNRENVARDAVEVVIEGGNHAQFGSYGVQKGDGRALITAEEQVEETVLAIEKAVQSIRETGKADEEPMRALEEPMRALEKAAQ